MKKIFTFLLATVGLFANAQSLRLINDEGSYLGNNDTIDVVLEENEVEIDTYIGYQNLTNQEFKLKIKKEILTSINTDRTMILFCIGNCYDGPESDIITVAPEATVVASPLEEYSFHSSYAGQSCDALVKYTFQNAENQSDFVTIYIRYKYGTGIRQADLVKSLQAYPNPAVSRVSVSYTAPSDRSYLVIKNLTGKEVFRTRLSGVSGRQEVSLCDFAAGVYFYGIESEGKMVCTKKLLVK